MNVVLVIAAFMIIFAYETPKLLKAKLWRELLVFAGLLSLGFTLGLLLVLGLPAPNPVKGIELATAALVNLFGGITDG